MCPDGSCATLRDKAVGSLRVGAGQRWGLCSEVVEFRFVESCKHSFRMLDQIE